MLFRQTSFNDTFHNTMKQWATDILYGDNVAFFHIFVPYNLDDKKKDLDEVRQIIRKEFPKATIVGCSATGDILGGKLNDDELVITAMIFEEASSYVNIITTYDTANTYNADTVLAYAKSLPNLKGIELLTASTYQPLEEAGAIVDALPEDVNIFGGVAVGDEDHQAYVFANDYDCSTTGSVIVFYGGPDLHILTNRMFGWKPIGYPLQVTHSEGDVVYEIDGKPAYDVYEHYLHIEKGRNFFYDALEFPMQVQVDKETKYIRHAKSVNPDGSIVMSSNVPEGSYIHLTYGDPRRIIRHTKQTGLTIREFSPQMIYIINCMGRKLFWGDKAGIEIGEISKNLKSMGFSALGEIMRSNKLTLLNNLSVVTVAMREGDARNDAVIAEEHTEQDSNMPITARLAIFINTITEELMDKNAQLSEMLYKASHDALTNLLNRGAIERNIYEINDTCDTKNWYLLMFDIDDFKQVNDTYGHAEGDMILKAVSSYLLENVCTIPNVQAGRWGGEEFMILLSNSSDDDAYKLAECICSQIKKKSASHAQITISIGVTKHHESEKVADTINRVDELLYKAKELGKNQVSCEFI
ncbi:diguanylate cyclase (GGDEF) domain-containing protein [Pseudobutyrivibrio sp. UC1225]|uniref:sensor domain-containing diguanylate cyclase n=1 Tax=Pseudobutyrivibrio sp. UC1225 TaxID=1798185 RepID=UPI0008E36043|nr:diguanylate cyclase [Pseudobutyrivibrio sp. UC1225]SFN60452.1 diguanylate cyclase (GGDEF) domain-containing protein [Pseudobutyrivibrio sp. UC1225]